VRFYGNLPSVSERTTAGGRTLQIRRRAMPDGGVVALYSDITERKAAEEKMEQARLQAELANRAKGDFLANMSHELRTPLNAIIGFSEVLATEILGPVADKRQLEYIKDIHSSGLLLLSIINDVLDMSKIEAGKLELAHEKVIARPVIMEAIRMVSERARSRRVNLATTAPDGELSVWGDERAIKQIMLNLLSNAVKFSHEGGRVDIRASLDATGGLMLEVQDYGIGMAADEIDRALQPFGQAKPATTKTHGGTGLGLPIAKGLAEAHGGNLTIESSPGRGTKVRITLPPQSQLPDVVQDLLRNMIDPPGTERAVA
jgi:signal transduction histidine kinase